MVANSEGVEAVARLIAPALIGEDPRQLSRIERLMDHTVQGTATPRRHLMQPVGTLARQQPSLSGCCLEAS